MTRGKEDSPIGSEALTQDAKLYLARIHQLLRKQQTLLSLGGIDKDRSRLGIVNELALDVIRVVVGDDLLLYSEAVDETDAESNATLTAPSAALPPNKRELLTGLRIALEWAREIVDREEYISPDHPIAVGFNVVRTRMDPLVDQERVVQYWNAIKGNKEKIAAFVEHVQHTINDILYPSPFNRKNGHLKAKIPQVPT